MKRLKILEKLGAGCKMVTTTDIKFEGEKPIIFLEMAVLACLLSYYEERECVPDLEVRIGGGEVKIRAIDFHTGDSEKHKEFDKLKEHCETCYILNIIKMGYSVVAE